MSLRASWLIGDFDSTNAYQAIIENIRRRVTRMIRVSAEYHRLKRRDRQVLGLEDLTDADIVALEATRAPDASKAFEHELKP
jgi:hypothetical protein